MSLCCDLAPQVVPSPEGERLSGYLRIVAFGHLIMAILYFCGSKDYISMGLMDLIFAWFVYIAYKTYNYCFLTTYIWFLVINLISTFVYLGMLIQYPGKNIGDAEDGMRLYVYAIVVFSISMTFYSFALYVAYRSYKEFKALAMFPYVDGAAGECISF